MLGAIELNWKILVGIIAALIAFVIIFLVIITIITGENLGKSAATFCRLIICRMCVNLNKKNCTEADVPNCQILGACDIFYKG